MRGLQLSSSCGTGLPFVGQVLPAAMWWHWHGEASVSRMRQIARHYKPYSPLRTCEDVGVRRLCRLRQQQHRVLPVKLLVSGGRLQLRACCASQLTVESLKSIMAAQKDNFAALLTAHKTQQSLLHSGVCACLVQCMCVSLGCTCALPAPVHCLSCG